MLDARRGGLPARAGRLGKDPVVDSAVLGRVSETALTRDMAISMRASSLPNTFVPARSPMFPTFATALAYRRGLKHLFTGVCETDYSNNPDCREDTIKAVRLALNLGMEARCVVHTPLMWIDKAETWALAKDLGGEASVKLVRDETHTCYNGDRTCRHDWGRGCGKCPACLLRCEG